MNNLTQNCTELAQLLCNKFISSGYTLSTAESCTGGLMGSFITSIPGSSKIYLGGIISYCNEIKEQILGVDRALLKKYGAVSDSVALAMVKGCRITFGTTFSVSITGIAGPGGAVEGKDIGLVYIACASAEKTICEKFNFDGTRDEVRMQAVIKALEILLNI